MKEKQRIEIPPELVRRAQAGDRAAFEELYQRSGAALWRTIFSMVRDEDTAWDVHQNSYLLAWKNLAKLEKPEAFLPWLRRIAVHEAVKELQKEQPLRFTELAEEDGTEPEIPETRPQRLPEPELDRQEAARLVREILDSLPQRQRLILGMYYYEELSIPEIARALGVTQGTVKTQLHLGRKKVEARVKGLEEQGVKLYGTSPLAFLLALLDRQEPARALGRGAVKAALSAEEPVVLTARAVGTSFFHTGLGKLTAGLLLVAAAAGGLLGWRALRGQIPAPMGDYRPTETLALTEPARLSSEAPTEPEAALPTELETTIDAEVPPSERRMENPFNGPLASADGSILAAVYNAPYDWGLPAPTVNWNAGDEDRLVIYPRYPGSVVSAWRLVYDAQGSATIEETPVYSSVCGPEDCVAAALERPAEVPCWLLTVQTPDGREGSCLLTRNSRSGALAIEYLCRGEAISAENLADGSAFHATLATQMLGSIGYDTRSRQGSVYHVLPYDEDNPFVRLGSCLLQALSRALEPYGMNAESYVWDNWIADEAAVWTAAESRMEGDTCVTETGVVHEYYMNELYAENFVDGQGSPKLSVPEQIAGQARLFARDRLLGYAGHTAAEGEQLRFDLHGLLVYNPTLAAKTVSIAVNGEDAGSFALTEGDFFTWIPLDFPNQPGDVPLRVELRITETAFGAPEQAILSLWPDVSSNLRGGR